MIKIGKKAPKWKSPAYSSGEFKLVQSSELKGSWYVIYWWPFDFTRICNSEILGFQTLESEFAAIGVHLFGASCDSFHAHTKWFSDAGAFPSGPPKHDIIADNTHKLTSKFGFYIKDIGCASRAYVVVDPEGIVRSSGANFLNVARNPKDILVTVKAFVKGGSCSLSDRQEL
jgi:peroxiredoxin 2/4